MLSIRIQLEILKYSTIQLDIYFTKVDFLINLIYNLDLAHYLLSLKLLLP